MDAILEKLKAGEYDQPRTGIESTTPKQQIHCYKILQNPYGYVVTGYRLHSERYIRCNICEMECHIEGMVTTVTR